MGYKHGKENSVNLHLNFHFIFCIRYQDMMQYAQRYNKHTSTFLFEIIFIWKKLRLTVKDWQDVSIYTKSVIL